MGLWDTIKEQFEEGKESVQTYPGGWDEEEVKQLLQEAEHEPSEVALSTSVGIRRKSPLELLEKDERLAYALHGTDLDVDGEDEGSEVRTLITDEKIAILAGSMTLKTSQHTISYSDINGVTTKHRMFSHLELDTAGHSYRISLSTENSKTADQAAEYIQRKTRGQEAGDTADPNTSMDKLERLAELRDDGVISDEEFEEKKASLLEDI